MAATLFFDLSAMAATAAGSATDGDGLEMLSENTTDGTGTGAGTIIGTGTIAGAVTVDTAGTPINFGSGDL